MSYEQYVSEFFGCRIDEAKVRTAVSGSDREVFLTCANVAGVVLPVERQGGESSVIRPLPTLDEIAPETGCSVRHRQGLGPP